MKDFENLYHREGIIRVQCHYPKLLPIGNFGEHRYIPCGKCGPCRDLYIQEWTIRLLDEMVYLSPSIFITLTYNSTSLTPTLCSRHVVLFMKRVRKKLGVNKVIKYYYAGEYGDKGDRPHYHMILLGWRPKDCIFWESRKDYDLYISETLSNLWGNGFVTLGEANGKSIYYMMKYIRKDRRGIRGMSKNIGSKFVRDNIEKLIKDKKVDLGMRTFTLPRYYINLIRKIKEDETWLMNEPLSKKQWEQFKKMGPSWYSKLQKSCANRKINYDTLKEITLRGKNRELHG